MKPGNPFFIVIVDDEPDSRAMINTLLRKSGLNYEVIGEADSVKSGYEMISANSPDIVFLDVEIIGGTGFDLLERLDKKDFITIFITAFNHYAIKAIKFAAFDYLLKPIDMQEFNDTIMRAVEKLSSGNGLQKQYEQLKNNVDSNPDKIALPTDTGFKFIKIDDIIRCQAESNYTRFFLNKKNSLLTCHTLGEYEKMLSDYNFFRVHNSHLINMQHVNSYIKGKGGFVVMSDGEEVEVSVRKKEKFLQNFARI